MDITALFNLSYGLYVVSSKDGDRNVGCVVNSIFQVTSSPATLAISINKDNYTNQCVLKTGRFAVSILAENAGNNIIATFGFSSSRDKDKFESVEYFVTESGLPVLNEGVCSYLECKVIDKLDCFTHTIIVAEITDAKNLFKEPPMTYAYYHRVIKGKTPKNAPTYVEDKEVEKKTEEKTYRCSVCGYVHPGSREEFEALPDTYICPICSAPKSAFSLE